MKHHLTFETVYKISQFGSGMGYGSYGVAVTSKMAEFRCFGMWIHRAVALKCLTDQVYCCKVVNFSSCSGETL